MKLPLLASAISRCKATLSLPQSLSSGTGLLPAGITTCPKGYYWCYCSSTNSYVCCQIGMDCEGSSGVCACAR